MAEKQYRKGDVIFREGDEGDSFFQIEAGKVEVIANYGKENEKKRLEQGFGLKKILSYAERCGGYAEFSNEDGFRSVVELPVSAEHGLQT